MFNATAAQGRALLVLATLVLFPQVTALGDEVKGKWRLDLQIGLTEPGDEIRSQAANGMVIQQDDGATTFYPDPRLDSFGLGEARIETDPRVELRAGYGLHAWRTGELMLDVGIGHYDSVIEGIELSFLHDRSTNPLFQTRAIDGGSLKAIPVSIGLTARFSPTKRFNPYFGAGIGYIFAEFSESAEWRALADQLDQSLVHYIERDPNGDISSRKLVQIASDTATYYKATTNISTRVRDLWTIETDSAECAARGFINPITGFPAECRFVVGHDLERPEIDAPDSMFFELRGGVEWQWRPKVAVFTEFRFNWAARDITIKVDDKQQFGVATPNGTYSQEGAPVPTSGAPAYVSFGGIVETVGGVEDAQPGLYYLNGGVLDWGGFSFMAGVRFTL